MVHTRSQHVFRLPLLAAALLGGCAPAIDPGPSAFATAEAPVRLVPLEDPGSPWVHLEARIAAGSAFDPPGQEGLAALTARSLAAAGAGARSGTAVAEELQALGGRLEWTVDREWASLRLTCERPRAVQCVELFTDVLVHPRFEAADVAPLRAQALEELTAGLGADPEALGVTVLDTWVFEAHPYGHPVTGRSGVLPLLEAEDLQAFHEAHYVRSAVVAGLGGAWDPGLREALQERLDALPGTRPPELVLQEPLSSDGRQLLAVEAETPDTHLFLGQAHAVTRAHPDWPALILGIEALEGVEAWSEPRLRERRGVPLQAGFVRRQAHLVVSPPPAAPHGGAEALGDVLARLEQVVAEGPDPTALEAARGRLLEAARRQGRDPIARLGHALDVLPAALEASTREEVHDALRSHLDPETLRIVAVTGDGDALIEETGASAVGGGMTGTWAVSARGIFR